MAKDKLVSKEMYKKAQFTHSNNEHGMLNILVSCSSVQNLQGFRLKNNIK